MKLLFGILVLALVACDPSGTHHGNNVNNANNVNNVNNGSDGGNDADTDVDGGGDFELKAGIYALTGEDRNGAYTGAVEVLADGSVIHLQEWTTFTFETYRAALAWIGRVENWDTTAFSVDLKTGGFITSWAGQSRPAGVNPSVACSAAFVARDASTITGTFACAGRPELAFSETWTWQGAGGESPLWENARQLVPAHDPVPLSRKSELFSLYESFHALETVAPYTGRSDFQEAMHYWVHDPTDLDYYRADASRVRVIQGVVDPISLREARQRRDAFATDLHQKQAIFEAQTPQSFINELGMMVDWDASSSRFVDSGDSMLWTGLYAASQAMRWMQTGDAAAFSNMIKSSDGQLLCYDVIGQPGQFARTVRVHEGTPSGSWVQGQGAYADVDYLLGANNDMLKGYFVGFLWTGLALTEAGGQQARLDRMVALLDDLRANFSEISDGSSNELYVVMLLYLLRDCDNTEAWESGYAECLQLGNDYEILFQTNRPWIVDQGNGAMWEYGTSDWSGNHLIIQTLIGLYVMSTVFDGALTGELRDGLKEACERVRSVNQGLYQLACGALGSFATPPPEIEAALWFMQQYPAPKTSLNSDRRIDPDFSLSPFPNLPWKNDWTTDDRTQSLRAYPLFEMSMDSIQFKANPFSYRSGESAVLAGGIDYLFMYWFGRTYDLIP